MAVYFANTEITGIKDLFPLSSKDITGLYFADTELFTVWGEYDGTLPAQYSANGSMLADYRVYGASGGVGDRTGNLWNGTYVNARLSTSASTYNTGSNTSVIIPCEPETEYTVRRYESGNRFIIATSDVYPYNGLSVTPIQASSSVITSKTFTTDNDAAYIIIFVDTAINYNAKIYCGKGSTAPAEYVPYGYKLPMSVSDGTTPTTTPIYIGSDPLGEDEYVDYGEQKVYRCPNLLDMDTLEPGYLATDGTVHTGTPASRVTDYMEVAPGGYILSVSRTDNLQSGNNRYVNFYNANKEYLSYTVYTPNPILKDMSYTFAINNPNIKYVRITLDNSYTKAVFHIENATPTDPPVPLPALPTVDGTNVVDYAGQSAAVPSRFAAKYRKEGFN